MRYFSLFFFFFGMAGESRYTRIHTHTHFSMIRNSDRSFFEKRTFSFLTNLYSDRSWNTFNLRVVSTRIGLILLSFFLSSLQRSAEWAILSIYTWALTLCLMGSFLSEFFSP